MSRKLRIAAVVVGVLIVIVLIIPFLIPINNFRPTIEEKASQALGRKVQVGDLSLSLLSGSLTAQSLSVGDDPRFSQAPFLSAKSVKVGVELIPLIFSKSLNITGVTIENPEVTLLRNPAGQWNYSSLGGSSARHEGQPASKPSGSSSEALSIQKFALEDGRIIVGSTNSQKRSTYDHVNVDASDVSMTSRFPFTITADLPAGGKFKLTGNAGPVDSTDTSLTPLDAKLEINGLNLASTGFLDPSAGLGGLLDMDANLSSQNGSAETKGTAKLSKALLVAGGSPASVPVTVDFSTKYDLRKNAGVLNPSTVKIGNAAAHLGGTYNSAGEATMVNLKLDAKGMPAQDLEAFLPALGINLPKGASLQTGTLDANLNLTGPANRLVTAGNVGLFNAKVAGFDLGSKMSAISALGGMKTGNDLQIEKLTTNLHMTPEGLNADDFLAVVPSVGNLAGAGTVNSKNQLDFKMAATLANAAGGAASPVSSVAGILGKVTGGGSCKSGASVPFLIEGTTAEPKFVPDVQGLAAGMLKSQLGCAGKTSSAAKQQNPVGGVLGGLINKN
ncbi:MAG TPA: AsmA family protein [Terriglobales bacterium]|jgi:AsmA protein|nr:AsmA family protein [Terriglobales bacterium]